MVNDMLKVAARRWYFGAILLLLDIEATGVTSTSIVLMYCCRIVFSNDILNKNQNMPLIFFVGCNSG